MKHCFLVTFEIVINVLDQKAPDFRAKRIAQYLREQNGIVLLSNQWAIQSNRDAYGVREEITRYFGLSDRVTIIEMSGDFSHYWTIDSLNGWPPEEKVEPKSCSGKCNWNFCEKSAVEGALFCEDHVQAPTSRAMPEWVRILPSSIGTGLATSVLFEMLKLFAESCMFSDEAAAEVDRHLAKLKDEQFSENAIDEVANLIEAMSQDPSLQKFMYEALRNSARIIKTND